MQIGLVEVGSSTIRYFVAAVAPDMSFRPHKIETVAHSLHPSKPTLEAIAEVNARVEAYLADGGQRSCDVLLAYGTAACRAADTRHPGALSPLLRVLTPAEEATAAWVAGLLCTPATPGTNLTVVDAGSGSTEIVRASWNGRSVIDLTFHSVEIGNVALVEAFCADTKDHIPHVVTLIGQLKDELASAGIYPSTSGHLYLVGGVATRTGWLLAGNSGDRPYRPEELNGARIPRDRMIALYQRLSRLYLSDPQAAQRLVDTREGGREQLLRLLSELPFLALLANYLDPRGQYLTSGFGVRHGIAFLLQRGLIA